MQKMQKILMRCFWSGILFLAAQSAGAVDAIPPETAGGNVNASDSSAAVRLMPPHDYSLLEGLIIQEGGRKKPLLTFARESLLTMSGRSSFAIADGVRVEPMPFIISIWLSGRDWSGQPLITMDYGPLKEELGLPIHGKRFSFQEIVSSPRFAPLYEEMEAVREEKGADAFTEFQKKLNDVAHRLAMFRALQGGSAFTVVPHPTDQVGTWVTIPDGHGFYTGAPLERLNRATIELFAAYHGELDRVDTMSLEEIQTWRTNLAQRGEEPLVALLGQLEAARATRELTAREIADFRQARWQAAATEFLRVQGELAPEVMPSAGKVRAELIYEHFHFFRWAWILCLLASIVVGVTWLRWPKSGLWGSGFLSLAALIMLVIGMSLRVYISGRAPVTNMYETVIWVGFGILVFALIFELRYKCRYYLASGAPLAGIFLILADSVPAILDPSIAPLAAVLRDNFWLTTHVLTVTISYAAFALAFALGHIVLGKQIIQGRKMGENKFLYAYIYRAMQVGILLLTIGVILGGVWANYSWGRFWGWDPKETWALIAILCYLAALHGRLVGWWKGFGLTIGSVIGFMAVLMCWYGVNFILGAGLHSYGFGVGGTGYVVGFVVAEVLFVLLAVFRRYQPGSGNLRASAAPQV